MKKTGHVIKSVCPGSIAEEMGIAAGDILLAINGEKIGDVFDYRYLIKDEYIEALVQKQSGEQWLLEVDKEYDDDLGIVFENELMSEFRSCSNKCIFCFIDQMPPGMRDNLYFKDDDSRLSFLQGNYITLTNMNDEDIERIIQMQLAPINISIQTTNPELRCKMLNNRFAGEKLKYLDRLYDGHVEMNGQIVCCKGVNDQEELRRSITDLMKYLPYMQSVSVVPAGISKYREGLYPIPLFTSREAGEIIDMIEEYQKVCYEKYGLHFIHASDEFYIAAGRDFPEEDRYDGYLQLENGVGMMRLFREEFTQAFRKVTSGAKYKVMRHTVKRTITIATGKLAYSTVEDFAGKLMDAYPGLTIHVYAIRNDFFGETITVSGLITGRDLISQLLEKKNEGVYLGKTLLVPSNMLRSGEGVFLDDVTLSEVESALGLKVVAVESSGNDFVNAVLHTDYSMRRANENFVYVEAFDKKKESL